MGRRRIAAAATSTLSAGRTAALASAAVEFEPDQLPGDGGGGLSATRMSLSVNPVAARGNQSRPGATPRRGSPS